MKLPKYEILTVKTCYNIGDTEEERMSLVNEQNETLVSLGYNLNKTYRVHFFESYYSNETTDCGSIDDLIQQLAIKDGVNLVKFETGKIGFVAYYNGVENGFEIIGGYDEIKERVTEYIADIEENYKGAYIAMWETCCDLCGWIDLDNPNSEEMIDIILDYNNSLFDDGLKKILRGGEV